jgi:hypothetical protein
VSMASGAANPFINSGWVGFVIPYCSESGRGCGSAALRKTPWEI